MTKSDLIDGKQELWVLRLRRGSRMPQIATGQSAHDPLHIVGFSHGGKSLFFAFA
ncbi:MAG: hypothetical protein ACYCT1_10715 [Steroidobacteraceae bacterium]